VATRNSIKLKPKLRIGSSFNKLVGTTNPSFCTTVLKAIQLDEWRNRLQDKQKTYTADNNKPLNKKRK